MVDYKLCTIKSLHLYWTNILNIYNYQYIPSKHATKIRISDKDNTTTSYSLKLTKIDFSFIDNISVFWA